MSNTPIRHMIGHEDALADEFETILGLRTILDGVVRGGASAINVTPTGTLLVDFTVQPITATGVTYGASGQTVTNDGAFGNYTVTREIIAHDSALTGNATAKVDDGWSFTNTASSVPTSAKDFRPSVTFSPALDFTDVESLTFEWGFPQKSADFSQGLYVGIRPRLYQGANYFYTTNSMMTFAVVQKSEKMTTVVPFDDTAYAANGWSLSGTPNAALIDKIQPRLDVIYNATGGTEVVLRRIWANRRQAKALVCFTFDDGSADHYTMAAPILQAAGGMGCEAVIADRIDVTPTYMTAAQIRSLHDDYGWAIHNHMVSNDEQLEVGLTYTGYTAGTPNRVTFTCLAAATTAMVDVATTPTVEIRNTWGPEYAGTHNVLSIGSGTFDIEVAGQSQVTISGLNQPGFRMDWPGETRSQRVTNQVLPCNTAIAAAVGKSNWRGKSVFVVPGGNYDPAIIPELEAAGFSGARGTGKYYSAIGSQTAVSPLKTATTTVSGTQYAVGWFDKWAIGVVDLGGVQYADIAKYTALIDEAVAKGYFLAFMIHTINDTPTPSGGATSKQVLQSLADTCAAYKATGQLQFVTLDQIVAAT